MNQKRSFRIVLNILLIAIVVISVLGVGFVSIKEYRSNRIPEMYSDKQITKIVKDKYSGFEFSKDDIWDIKSHLSEDKESYKADVDIVRMKALCRTHYGVRLTFKLENGSWEVEELPRELSLVEKEWLFENSEWAAITEDGTKYEILFLPELEARLSVQEDADPTMTEETSDPTMAEETSGNTLEETTDDNIDLDDEEETSNVSIDDSYTDADNVDKDVDDSNISDVDQDTKGSIEVFCHLNESEDGSFFEGSFEVGEDESISLIVTEESVQLMLSNESEGLFLKKK